MVRSSPARCYPYAAFATHGRVGQIADVPGDVATAGTQLAMLREQALDRFPAGAIPGGRVLPRFARRRLLHASEPPEMT